MSHVRVHVHVTAIYKGPDGRETRRAPVWDGIFIDDTTDTVQRMLLATASALPGQMGRGLGWGMAKEIRVAFTQEEDHT